jgi:K+-transporting ATPase KdpF subunit
MTLAHGAGLLLVVALAVYLCAALLWPEKFQ